MKETWKEQEQNTRMTSNISGDLLPYTSVYLDASLKDLSSAALECLHTNHDRSAMIRELQNMWTTVANPNPVLPILSVRTGFDLFLRVMNFPPGSEVIMSAMNIPDMVKIVRHHELHIVPLDISIDTAAPKVNMLPQLVSPNTVAIVIAHLYGKWAPMEKVITFAKKHNLYVIEDCAECFCGFDRLSHPETDLALFSFGVIKFYTSFGGAIAKIKPALYGKMLSLYETYRIQSQREYLKKILKYVLMYFSLNSTTFNYNMIKLLRVMGYPNYKDGAVKLLRGFPANMVQRIRERPSGALLATMLKRQKSFSPTEFCLHRLKGEYVASRLPPSLDVVGIKAAINNYWLFPILAEDPDNLTFMLNAVGVEAYRGASQLNIIEPLNGSREPLLAPKGDNRASHIKQAPRPTEAYQVSKQSSISVASKILLDGKLAQSVDAGRSDVASTPANHDSTAALGSMDLCEKNVCEGKTVLSQREKEGCEAEGNANHIPSVNVHYPHEAKYLVDHVIYLPVNKLVPFHVLNHMVKAIHAAVAMDKNSGDQKVKVVLPSKL